MTTEAQAIEDNEPPRGWFIALGIFLIATGVGALIFPQVATLSVELFVGSAMLIGGIATLVHAFKSTGWGGFLIEIFIAATYIAGGALFLFNPLAGIFTLTALLAAFFAFDGILRILMAIQIRGERSWPFFLVSGLLSLMLAILIVAGIANGASLAFIGFLVGINFVFAGVSYIVCGREVSVPLQPSTA